MTARPLDPASRRRPLQIAVALVLVMVAVLLAAGCVSQGPDDPDSVNHLKIKTSTRNITRFVANNSGLKDELDSYGLHNSTEFPVSSSITKYDVVTIDTKILSEQLKSGQGITISINGTDYPAEFTRMNFENIDDGIDSYRGKLVGKNSEILFTASENALLGYITLGSKTYWIEPVSSKDKGKTITSPLHLIYNAQDVISLGNVSI